jgi:hypothetical protein
MMAQFQRYIGIDYSGAQTPQASLSSLRVYLAEGSNAPVEVPPQPKSAKRYWTRRGIAEWLREELATDVPTIVGIDHGFSFPIAYFNKYSLPLDWPKFLDDFQRHWPTDENIYVDFVRDGGCGDGSKRCGDPRWLRLTEQWTATAKSVFLFDCQGSVAKSTFAGLPWLRHLRNNCQRRIHFWPFDGWEIPNAMSVIAEVYPSLWMRRYKNGGRNADCHAAYAAASWLQRADLDGSLAMFLQPPLTPKERELAAIEGWILGVV